MTKYPRGRDIAVNWTLDLGGSAVDLAACDLLFEYHTGAGSKSVPRSAYTIYNNVLSWTFHGEDQIAYGVYGLRLVAASGSEEYVFHQEGAFEIIHGEVSDEEQTLPLESSVETEQEPAEEEEEQETGTPVYVSSSPIHVEKVPLGSNITVRWSLLTTAEFDFDLAECDLYLYYAAAGSGFRAATNYELSTENGYVLTWNFAAAEQVRFGLYSLLLDVRRNGAKIATLVKDDAFSLVHRKGSIFPDRIIDFESIVTTMGGGALYTLIDVNNDGYSTVYRSDGVTPAQVDDLIIYDGNLWYAIDGSDLPYIRGLRGDLDALGNTALRLSNRIEDLEGNVGELWLTAQEFGVRMSDAEGYIGQLTLTAREFAVRMSDAEGNIGQLTLTSQQFGVRMSDAEGNIGQLTLTSQLFDVRMSDVEGNVGELMLTSEEFGVRMTNAEGSIGQLTLTAEQFAVRMSDTEGNVSLLQQTATSLTSQIQDAQGNISTLQQTATSLTSRIQSAEGSISTIAQTAESIQLQVDNQRGDIAALEVSARAITSRVSDAEGNISILEQTATSLTSQIEDAEGNISVLQQTAASLTSQIQDAEGNISTLQQTATQISSRVTSIEGEFGEGGRVTVAESTIVQQAGLIATKVSQTEYDANNQAISTHFSTIEQTASQISTRVAAVESEFGEGGRVTVAESTIVQQAGLIATKVSQTDYDANNQAISTRFSSIEQTAGEISASVTNVSNNLSTYEALTDAVLTNLQDQIDGVVETWYAEGEPTLLNYPVNTWEQADYPNHIGDLYYDKLTGKAYRFMLDDEQDPAVYVWVELADEDIAKALALAGEKRRVFVSTPYAPYDAGDLWVKERTVNGETTREIYRCKRSRAAGETIDLANDWVPADDYAVTVNKANLKILADAIVGEVAAFTYDSEGKISSASKSNITQTADAIRLSVSNQAIGTALGEGGSINDALLDTGIDITNGDITLTANHILLQNQSAVSGLELTTIGTGANQRVVIDVDSLNVHGIFTTSEWTGQNGIRAGILSDAETAAETYANSSAYLTNYVLPVVQGEISGLAVDAQYNYLKTALENQTTALGGLLLTTLIQLGATQSGGSWEVHSGISGEYVETSDTSDPDFVAGHGIAAWYGGAMVDREDLTHYWTAEQIAAWNAMTDAQRETSNLAAKTLFRMDGSGYLANGAISWGAAGDLHLLDNVYIGPQMDQTLASISTWVTLLSTWFKDDTITLNGTNYRVLRVNMASDPASTTGFQGVVWNGFFISGGDQIVIDGTPGGGGGGGGATTLAGLDDTNITNPQAGQILSWSGTKWVNTNAPTGSITSVSLAAGATNGTLHLVVNGTAQSDVAVTGLGSMAYASTGDYVPIATAKTITAAHTFSNGLNLTTSDNWQNVDRALYFSYPEIDSRLSYYNVNSSTGLTYNPATGALKAGSFVKRGGTSSQFLKADGSVDSSAYITGITPTMVTNALGYTPANVTALADYVKLNPGAVEQTIRSSISNISKGVINLWRYGDNWSFIGFSNGATETYLGSLGFLSASDPNAYRRKSDGNYYKIWDAGNDGSGSGLDADLLDGQHGSYYAPLSALDNYLPLYAGTSKPLTDSLYIITGDTDKCIQFSYDTRHISGAAWRILSSGSGSGDTNYLSFQTGGSTATATTWYNVLRLSMDNRYVGINMDTPAYSLDVNGTARVTSLKIGSATITWNSNGYLHIDQPLVTAGDQIVISGTPGGGGGGGATTLAGLDDVAITSVANGQLLQYNGSKWVNVAASTVGRIYSAGTGISISNTNVISLNGSEYYSATTSRTANTVLAAPNGSNGVAGFRALVAADIPTLTKSKISDFPTNVSAFTNDAGYISSYVNTWRNVYTGGTSRVGTGTDTKAINFAAGSGITISYKAAGTGSGQSGSNNYFSVEIGVTANTYQPLDSDLTAIAAISSGTGLLKRSVSGTTVSWSIDTNTYLTGNQTITLSGDVSGSGTTSISTTIGNGKVTNAMLAGSIANSKLSNSSITINGSSTSLGGSFSTASITAGTAGQSSASTGVSFSIPYVTMNKYGIVTAYGTHTHTISASDLTTTIGSTTYAPYNSAGYLPLSAGSSYPLTGTLFVALNQGIGSPGSSYSMIFQDSSFATYVGEPDSMTIIRTGNNNLFHRKVSTDYVIWDASNSNKSDVAWACSTLTADGDVTIHSASGNSPSLIFQRGQPTGADYTDCRIYNSAGSLIFENNGTGTTWTRRFIVTDDGKVGVGAITPSYNLDVDGTLHASGNISTSGYVSVGTGGANSYVGSDAANNIFLHNSSGYVLVVDGVNVRRGGYATTATLGNSTYPWAGITATSADFRLTNFTDFHIYRNNSVGSAGITYYSAAQTASYWNVGMDPTGGTYGGRFYWYYTGNYVAYMSTSGTFTTTGDQVVSSDLTLKENLTPVTYSVADIAKARAVEFDWKDGRGHSMGSIAQDWLGIAPALVHGEEGNMSLAYGQLALVNTIIEARAIESLQVHESEQDKEIRELRERIERLEMENERLRMN